MIEHEGYPVAPRSRQNIRIAASHARKVLQLRPGRIQIPELLDQLSAKYNLHYDVYETGSGFLPRQVEACWQPEHMTIYIRDDIYDEMAGGGQRAVFTFGHELGHALLGHQITFNRLTAQTRLFENSEWQANTYAAEFTMPLEEIVERQLRTAPAIASFFGVSLRAASIRIEDLKKRGEI